MTQAITLNTKIPIIIFPLIFIFSRTIIVTKARQPKITRGFLISPRVTSVTGWSATTPIISKPIIAKNNPIPAPIPSFKLFGIEFIIHALIGVNDIAKKRTPATNTPPKASCGV